LRILLVSDSYPPLVGGATLFVHALARELTNRGHQIAVVTCAQDGAPGHELDAGVEVHRVQGLTLRVPGVSADPFRNTPPPFPDPEMTVRILRIARRFGPDVVHSYGWLTYSCAAALAGQRTPLIVSAHDYGNICAVRTLMRKGEICEGPALAKCLDCAVAFYGPAKGALAVGGVLGGRPLLRRNVTGVHSISRFVEAKVEEYLFPVTPEPLAGALVRATIPSFRPEVEGDVPDEAALGLLPEAPFILFVGALRRIKGLEPLLAAYAGLANPPPLVLIGTRAPDTPSSFPAGVTVLGATSNATVLAAWDRALFGVSPSLLAEPLGIVVHEAMSRGTPVIGSTPGGHADMIEDGKTGFLVPAGDVAALTAAMRRLIEDGELRDRMATRARTVAERFTADALVPQFESLYRRAIDVGPGSSRTPPPGSRRGPHATSSTRNGGRST